MLWFGLQCVIVVFPDHSQSLFFLAIKIEKINSDDLFHSKLELTLSYDLTSGSEITPCNKIDK